MVSIFNHTKRKTELLHQPSVGDNYVSDLSVMHQWSNEWLSTDQLPDYWPIDYSGWLLILEQNSTNIATDILNDRQLRSSPIHRSTTPIRHMIQADGILKCSAKATNTIAIYGLSDHHLSHHTKPFGFATCWVRYMFATNMSNSLPLFIHCFNFSFNHIPEAISVIYTPKFSVNPVAVKRWSFWKLIIFTSAIKVRQRLIKTTLFHLLLFDWWPFI